jgi:hypothetical protein
LCSPKIKGRDHQEKTTDLGFFRISRIPIEVWGGSAAIAALKVFNSPTKLRQASRDTESTLLQKDYKFGKT